MVASTIDLYSEGGNPRSKVCHRATCRHDNTRNRCRDDGMHGVASISNILRETTCFSSMKSIDQNIEPSFQKPGASFAETPRFVRDGTSRIPNFLNSKDGEGKEQGR